MSVVAMLMKMTTANMSPETAPIPAPTLATTKSNLAARHSSCRDYSGGPRGHAESRDHPPNHLSRHGQHCNSDSDGKNLWIVKRARSPLSCR